MYQTDVKIFNRNWCTQWLVKLLSFLIFMSFTLMLIQPFQGGADSVAISFYLIKILL